MQTPTPGQQLQRLNDLFRQLRAAVITDSNPAKKEENLLAPVMAKVLSETVAMGPDSVKFVIDHLGTEEATAQGLSDVFLVQAGLYNESSKQLRSEFLKHMKSRNVSALHGSTWSAELAEASEMEIDRKKLFTEATKFQVQVPMIDEKKLNEAIAAGEEIPGLTIKKTQAVEFKLQKKTPPAHAH